MQEMSNNSNYFKGNCLGFCFFRMVVMEFYGKNDLTLGVFLERYCFR